MSITKQVARAHGITSLQKAPDKVKLQIYKLTLEEMFDALGHDLQAFPEIYIHDFKASLDEINDGLVSMKTRGSVRDIGRILRDANANLSLAANERRMMRSVEYYQALLICREKIFETLELLSKVETD